MRFMILYRSNKESAAPPSEQGIAAVEQLIEDMAKAGVLIATDGLQPSRRAHAYGSSGGKFTVTGPFAETKELIAGFAIVRVKSEGEAIELAKRFLKVMGEGESETRLMRDTPAFESRNPAKRPVATAKR